jgi:hypothetical protein
LFVSSLVFPKYLAVQGADLNSALTESRREEESLKLWQYLCNVVSLVLPVHERAR